VALALLTAPARAEPPALGNALAGERSPYLSGAASQPVHWQPWGERAFEAARRLRRPLLLDIGAAWCHWCHVMDRESYDNPRIAEAINRGFVPVKVDRDASPGLDRRYQTAALAAFGVSGWPLTVFLTPDGEPIFAGTYFPPEDQDGRPGLTTVLAVVAESYRDDPEAVTGRARAIALRLAGLEALAAVPGQPSPPLRDSLVAAMRAEFDAATGGFPAESGTQFPRPSALSFLLRLAVERGDGALLSMVTTTLDRMARGAIHDHVAGGFHRYAVDRGWRVPHFEKLMAPNAELLSVYLAAYQATGNPLYRDIAEGIVGFAEALRDPGGGFWASQDADGADGVEGSAYTWTEDEIAPLLAPEEGRAMRAAFGIGVAPGPPRAEPGRYALERLSADQAVGREIGRVPGGVRQALRSALAKLGAARAARPGAPIDRSRYADANGLMIRAWLEASVVLGRSDLAARALHSLDALLRSSHVPAQGISHVWGERGRSGELLDDQVFVAEALMTAFQVTAEARYLAAARDVLDHARRTLWDAGRGGFRDHRPPASGGPLSGESRPIQDLSVASGNGAAALALLRLHALSSAPEYREWARETLAAFAGSVARLGAQAGAYAMALDLYLTPPVQVAVVGGRSDPATVRLWREALGAFRPGKVVLLVDSAGSPKDLPAPIQAKLRSSASRGAPETYVCAGTLCSFPTGDAAAMAELIRSFGRPGWGVPREENAGLAGSR
jgi:uncharacterized protein YyaL (SSP411 family)